MSWTNSSGVSGDTLWSFGARRLESLEGDMDTLSKTLTQFCSHETEEATAAGVKSLKDSLARRNLRCGCLILQDETLPSKILGSVGTQRRATYNKVITEAKDSVKDNLDEDGLTRLKTRCQAEWIPQLDHSGEVTLAHDLREATKDWTATLTAQQQSLQNSLKGLTDIQPQAAIASLLAAITELDAQVKNHSDLVGIARKTYKDPQADDAEVELSALQFKMLQARKVCLTLRGTAPGSPWGDGAEHRSNLITAMRLWSANSSSENLAETAGTSQDAEAADAQEAQEGQQGQQGHK